MADELLDWAEGPLRWARSCSSLPHQLQLRVIQTQGEPAGTPFKKILGEMRTQVLTGVPLGEKIRWGGREQGAFCRTFQSEIKMRVEEKDEPRGL